MRKFLLTVGKIALPVALQCMLQSSFSIIDQLMIGKLGDTSISAVGLGGNFSLIFSVVIGAIGTVAGIIIAQFIGAKDEDEAWRGFWASSVFAVLVASCFMVASLFFAKGIIGLYTNDMKVIVEGTPYFQLISFTFIPMALSTILATWLRCNERAAIPLVASFGAVICNTGLNYLLIFGKCGMPKLGVRGAGYATAISQLLNLILILLGFIYCVKVANQKMVISVRMKSISLMKYLIMVTPILFSEFMWSLGQNINAGVYGHLDTESLTGYTMTTPIQGLLIGALSGLSAAASVLIGKQLGKKDYNGAYRDSKRIIWLGVAGAAILAVLLIALSGFYVSFFNANANEKHIAELVLIVFAIYSPVKVSNMILGGGIIRSGGNTTIIMVIDLIGTWLVGIPLCLFAAYVLHLPIVPVYAILTFEEVVRLAITVFMFRRKTWMRSLSK